MKFERKNIDIRPKCTAYSFLNHGIQTPMTNGLQGNEMCVVDKAEKIVGLFEIKTVWCVGGGYSISHTKKHVRES